VFRRLLWLMIGAGFGFGASFWLIRFIRQTVERYTPERVSADLAGALRGLGADLRAAIAEGREAMAEQEARLRADIEQGQGRWRRGGRDAIRAGELAADLPSLGAGGERPRR
jgi:hypothetical protein